MKSALGILARILQVAGAVLVIYCAFVLARAYLFQTSATKAFPPLSTRTEPPYSSLHQTSPPPSAKPELGAVIGRIDIPRLNVSTVILEGDGEREFQLGAGHVPGTAAPGEPGNMVIAAHRDTFFRNLREVSKGDEIVLTTQSGSFQYVVDGFEITGPFDTSVLRWRGGESLTLITCYPFSFIGPAPDRFVVHARRTGAVAVDGVRRPAVKNH